MMFQNGDAFIGDILRDGVMSGMFLSSRLKYPFLSMNSSLLFGAAHRHEPIG